MPTGFDKLNLKSQKEVLAPNAPALRFRRVEFNKSAK
jgi:hypothetical protein